MTQTVLVLGASGLFGGHCAQAFQAAGWTVRRYRRGTDMAEAAIGADVIVNGLNPPNYHDWARLIPAITAQVIAAARASGATVLIPGNVYVYGGEPGPWGPETPHRPVSRKGHIRAEMEAAYAASGVRTILLRGGDFLAPAHPGTLTNMVVLAKRHKGRITSLGRPDVVRAQAYLPDMARAAAALAGIRASLPAFADIPFAGLAFSTADFQREVEAQTGIPLRAVPFNWVMMRLLSPVWELARELVEMRYLYDLPHSLDPAPLERLLPGFRMTPLSQIVAEHLAQGSVTSTQTNRWREAASATARIGSPGAGQNTPDAVTLSPADGRT